MFSPNSQPYAPDDLVGGAEADPRLRPDDAEPEWVGPTEVDAPALTVKIHNSHITGNEYGAILFRIHESPGSRLELTNSTVSSNSANEVMGVESSLILGSAVLTGNLIEENLGVGVLAVSLEDAALTLKENLIRNNSGDRYVSTGLYVMGDYKVSISDNEFFSDLTGRGVSRFGILLGDPWFGEAWRVNGVIDHNEIHQADGIDAAAVGIQVYQTGCLKIDANEIHRLDGVDLGGIATGFGIRLGGGVDDEDHHIVGPKDPAGGGRLMDVTDPDGTATFYDLGDLTQGEANFSVNPMFVDPVNNDFHLADASPCIDRGVIGFVDLDAHTCRTIPAKDFDGDDRSWVDVGADEWMAR